MKAEEIPFEDREHFIRCDCGAYFDMRDLGQVFLHMHLGLPDPDWKYSVKAGNPLAYTRSGKRLGLN
jgi:hypothetical protein